jgi:hypothetical protein
MGRYILMPCEFLTELAVSIIHTNDTLKMSCLRSFILVFFNFGFTVTLFLQHIHLFLEMPSSVKKISHVLQRLNP